jgi:hypothetical protein
MNQEVNPWKTRSKKKVYDNAWINVEEHQVVNPGGGEGIYGKVSFKNKAIGIIPIDEYNNTWLVGQYRYAIDEYSWEIPMGGGPIEGDVLASAQRELKEETGLTAHRWEHIMRLHTSNSVTNEEGFVYLAQELEQGETNLEESEADLKLWKLPFSVVVDMVIKGKITDAISVAGILKVSRYLDI